MGGGPSKTRRVCIAVVVDPDEAGDLLDVLARANRDDGIPKCETVATQLSDVAAPSTMAPLQRSRGFSRVTLLAAAAVTLTLGTTIGLRHALSPSQPRANGPPFANGPPRATADGDSDLPAVEAPQSRSVSASPPPPATVTGTTRATRATRAGDRELAAPRPFKESPPASSHEERVPASAPASPASGRDDFIRQL